MAIIPEFYKNAVVSIGVKQNDSSVRWIGTGFFLVKPVDDKGNVIPFLVTNKHVLQNQRSIIIRMREQGTEKLEKIDTPLLNDDGSAKFLLHTDLNIDIAVLPLNASFITNNRLDFPAFNIDTHSMSSNELRENGVAEGSIIYMLGYTMGLVNKQSSVPICRMGCIARMSLGQITESHNILVDIQNFPGNSGSPIITRPELISIDGTNHLNKSVLVGIVHSYIPYREALISSKTGETVEIRSENSGLAYVHPVEYIREIVDAYMTSISKSGSSDNA